MTQFSSNLSPLRCRKMRNRGGRFIVIVSLSFFLGTIAGLYSFSMIFAGSPVDIDLEGMVSKSALSKLDGLKGASSVEHINEIQDINIKNAFNDVTKEKISSNRVRSKDEKIVKKGILEKSRNDETSPKSKPFNQDDSNHQTGIAEDGEKPLSDEELKKIRAKMLKDAEIACADKKGLKKEYCISDVSKTGDVDLAEDPFYN